MLRTLHLHGPMGKRFIKSVRMDVSSVAEACRALASQFPGFRTYVEGRDFKVAYGKSLKSRRLGEEHVSFQLGAGDLHFMPVVSGAGGKMQGIGKIIAGVVIAAVAWWAAPFTILGMSAGNIALLGVGMALTGVSQLLTPKQKQPKPEGKSYMFDNVDNTTEQGGPVPIVIGRCMAGSVVISGSVSTVDSDGFH